MSDPGIPAGAGNTVHRAHRFLCERVPAARSVGFDVRVVKHIPAGAGLGGGSADAAAFLTGACQLMGAGPLTSRADLIAVAGAVGADVPFCLLGGTAIGRGRGERLTRLPPLPPRRVIIAVPRARVSTKLAYDLLDRSRGRKNLTKALSVRSLYSVVRSIRRGHGVRVRSGLINDFEPYLCQLHAELAEVREGLGRFGPAAMTGSGSAFFVLPDRGVRLPRIRAAAPGAALSEARFVHRGVELISGSSGGVGRGSH